MDARDCPGVRLLRPQSARGHSRRQASIGFGCLRRKYDMAQATFYPQTLADHLPIALVLRQSG
jgi:hypothetical protein